MWNISRDEFGSLDENKILEVDKFAFKLFFKETKFLFCEIFVWRIPTSYVLEFNHIVVSMSCPR